MIEESLKGLLRAELDKDNEELFSNLNFHYSSLLRSSHSKFNSNVETYFLRARNLNALFKYSLFSHSDLTKCFLGILPNGGAVFVSNTNFSEEIESVLNSPRLVFYGNLFKNFYYDTEFYDSRASIGGFNSVFQIYCASSVTTNFSTYNEKVFNKYMLLKIGRLVSNQISSLTEVLTDEMKLKILQRVKKKFLKKNKVFVHNPTEEYITSMENGCCRYKMLDLFFRKKIFIGKYLISEMLDLVKVNSNNINDMVEYLKFNFIDSLLEENDLNYVIANNLVERGNMEILTVNISSYNDIERYGAGGDNFINILRWISE